MSKARENILSRLRQGANKRGDYLVDSQLVNTEEPIYKPLNGNTLDAFIEEAEKLNTSIKVFENQDFLCSYLKEISEDNQPIHCYEDEIKALLNTNGVNYSGTDTNLSEIKTSITSCKYLIARLGGILVDSASSSGRQLTIYPPHHIVIAKSSQLVDDLNIVFSKLKEEYQGNIPSMINVICGPSRTADIEKELVLGAHGPKDLTVLLWDDAALATS